MDKLKLAHDYFMKHGRNNSWMESDVVDAWKYADAMQAEADERAKRNKDEFYANLADPMRRVREQEWQPDWSAAPNDATAWEYLGHGAARWHTTIKGMYKSADLFGYSGISMFLVERP